MYNHAPQGYDCPFCRLVRGGSTSHSIQDDVIHCDRQVTAFLASAWWPNNPGHVLSVPSSGGNSYTFS